jgi:hypothetical protein
MDRNHISNLAREQFRQEQEADAVAAEVARLRVSKPSIWQRLVNLLPFTITWKK